MISSRFGCCVLPLVLKGLLLPIGDFYHWPLVKVISGLKKDGDTQRFLYVAVVLEQVFKANHCASMLVA